MTLYRQITLSIILLLFAGFSGTVIISTQNLRVFLLTQLETHAQDSATSLGLSLSHPMQASDMTTLNSLTIALLQEFQAPATALSLSDSTGMAPNRWHRTCAMNCCNCLLMGSQVAKSPAISESHCGGNRIHCTTCSPRQTLHCVWHNPATGTAGYFFHQHLPQTHSFMTADTGGIDRDEDNQFLIRALTDAAHSVDIAVIAQTVETSAERDTLEAMHLDGIQGFLTGNPQPLFVCKQTTSQALSS